MHRFNPAKIHKLTDPARTTWLPKEGVLNTLSLTGKIILVDFGSGPGYFSLPAAELIGDTGLVIAADIEPVMLTTLMQQAQQSNVRNIRPVLAGHQALPFETDSVDRVLTSLVLHEIGERAVILSEIKRILRPQGKLVIVEWQPWQTEHGPAPSERLSPEQLAGELDAQRLKAGEPVPLGNSCYILTALADVTLSLSKGLSPGRRGDSSLLRASE